MSEMDFLMALQNLHNPFLDALMVGATWLGNAGIIWILTGVVLLCIPKHRFCGIRIGAALILCLLVGCVIVKPIVARDRPCWVDPTVQMLVRVPKDYSFPSGHTMSSFSCATVLFNYKKKWGIIALVLAVLIAFSRMYLFVHYPTDVLAGLAIGVIMSALCDYLLRYIYRKKHSTV